MPLLSQVVRQVWRRSYTRLPVGEFVFVLGQDGLAGLVPGTAEDRSGEQAALLTGEEEVVGLKVILLDQVAEDGDERRVDGDGTGVALGATLEMAGLADVSVVGPLAADFGFGGVDEQLAPALGGQGGRADSQGDGFGDPEAVRTWASRFSLLADPNRLSVLLAIHRAGPIAVTDLALATGINEPAVSQILRISGTVAPEKDGRIVRYRLLNRDTATLLDAVSQLRQAM